MPTDKKLEDKIEKIKDKLCDEIDRYFPKIKLQGVNKGRGEAALLIALAIMEFKKLLESELKEAEKKGFMQGALALKGVKKLRAFKSGFNLGRLWGFKLYLIQQPKKK